MLKSKRSAPNFNSSGSSTISEEETTLFQSRFEISQESISPESNLLNRSFNRLLLEAIDEELSLLGVSVKQTIYAYLEREFKISRKDIPGKVEDFADAVEKLFGFGAKLVEIRIMEKLYRKVGDFKYFPENGDIVFSEYVAALREHYVKRMLT